MMKRSLKAQDTEEDLRLAFRVFDKDETGCIMTSELRYVFSHMSSELDIGEVDELINYFDQDNDGRIHFSEYWNLMNLRLEKP